MTQTKSFAPPIYAILFLSTNHIVMSFFPQWKENRLFTSLLGLLLITVSAFYAFGAITNLRQSIEVGRPVPVDNLITVEGTGSVTVKPDRATVTASVETKAATVTEAQSKNADTMNTLSEKFKTLGISADDLQTTNYSVYENQTWDPITQKYNSEGWIVSQSLEITVRALDLLPQVLTTAGENGATNIYGPQLTVDNREQYLDQARSEAIAEAKAKAQSIADSLGVKLVAIVNYSEWSDNGVYPMYAEAYAVDGRGGAPAPTIESGSEKVNLTVSVTYKLGQ